MTARLTILLSAIVISIAIVAGCGGGGDATGANTSGVTITTSSLSRDEFIAQASKACQRLRKNLLKRVLAYLNQHEKAQNQTRSEETKVFADMTRFVLLPTIRKEMAEIRKLGAPAGDEDEVEAFLDTQQEAVDAVAKLKHIVSRFEIERYFTAAEKLFREYGLDKCANE